MANETLFVRTGNGQGVYIDTEVTENGNYPVQGKGIKTYVDGALGDRGIPYTTTAPTEDNPDGLKFVVLTAEPDTKYSGYIYYIVEE